MFDRMRSLALAAAAAAVVSLAPVASQAAVIPLGGNVFGGTLALNEDLGTLDLADGVIVFSGVTGAATGGLTFDVTNSGSIQEASGTMQVLIMQSFPGTISFTELSFGGVAIALNPVLGGWAGTFSAMLPASFVMEFANANVADSVQISIAAIPLPAGGLLLIGALGGLALLRRRKSAQA